MRLQPSDGSDYVGFSEVLTFQPYETEQCMEFQVLEDSVMEGPEDFAVTLTAVNPEDVIIPPSYAVATVTIVDQTGWQLHCWEWVVTVAQRCVSIQTIA